MPCLKMLEFHYPHVRHQESHLIFSSHFVLDFLLGKDVKSLMLLLLVLLGIVEARDKHLRRNNPP
jgi:hypothetical protein